MTPFFSPRAKALLLAAALIPIARPASACDLCAVYAADTANGSHGGRYLALSEQFTRYDQLREEGQKRPDSYGQRLDSSITQLILGQGLGERWNLQLSLPLIDREYRRPGEVGTEHGSERGIGDLALTAQFTAWQWQREESSARWRLLAGVKLPTGSSRRYREELGAEETPAEQGAPVSGIHGHDLALGSGSVDGLFGTSISLRRQRWLARAEAQYAARSEGDYHYTVGDDLQWNAGIGRYLQLQDERSLAAVFNVSGEYKRFDRVDGAIAEDTRCRLLALGGQLQATLGQDWAADLRADFPVENYGSALQTAQRYRLRLSLLRHFQ